MAIKSGGLNRKSKASENIPTSSLADIAFLLLIFFMVSTVFQNDKNRPIDWHEAAAAEKNDEKEAASGVREAQETAVVMETEEEPAPAAGATEKPPWCQMPRR